MRRFEGALRSRERTAKRSEAIDFSTISPEVAKETVDRLLAHIEDPKNYIDKGGAAKVYRAAHGICVKKMEARHESENAHMMDLGNDIATESKFLERLGFFHVSGVRSPRFLGFIQARDRTFSAILMEELDAVNLQHVLNGTEKMPKSVNIDVFLTALSDYINELNSKAGIVHGDLEPRNVMIDRATGLPRIIDFGRAKSIKAMPKEKQKQLTDKEWEQLEEIERKVESYVPKY